VSRLDLQGEAQAEVLHEVRFEIAPYQELGNLGLGEAAELDVAHCADARNNGAGAIGLL